MKKQKLKSLSLSKKTVSTLTHAHSIKGGDPTAFNCVMSDIGCVTHHPTCMVETGISFCIRCMEEFTEGCVTHVAC
ncbi:hypothetical protein [Kordia sp.]|uniref:hypothetical protein n=1 Tax=Kordia sp. TaxID=1965332 RepID=UPI003D2DF840